LIKDESVALLLDLIKAVTISPNLWSGKPHTTTSLISS
jgi:hypothetical protein